MTQRSERFTVEGTPRISLRLPSGEARFVEGEVGTVEVRLSGRESTVERFLVEERGSEIVIEPEPGRIRRWSAVGVEVRVGAPPEVRVRLASGDVTVAVPVQTLSIESGAGDVVASEVAGDVSVKTASGDTRIERIGGRLDIAAASGDVRIGVAGGDVVAKTAAGDITIDEVAGDLSGHCASGDIWIGRYLGDSLRARTLSGDVKIGLLGGRRFEVSLQTLSGDVRTDFPLSDGDGAVARLVVKSMSGDIALVAAD